MHEFIINALIAAGIAILVSLTMGPFMIPFLTRLKVGQNIREEGPKTHFVKAGTPTMGGIIIITAVMAASFIMAGSSRQVLTIVLTMLAFAAIGFWDDYIKVVLKRSLGLRAREKIIMQLLISLGLGLLLIFYLGRGTEIMIPFSKISLDLGYLYLPFVIIVALSTVNAVNLTDGLDGLAAGVTFIVTLALSLIAVMLSNFNTFIACGALAGACLGFLFFNRYPAKVFMGDTGSMALGGAITAIAALNHAEIVLLIIGGVYVLEAFSVIIQVTSFKITGKRVFLMSPLHHHFELKGWKERKVVWFFYLLSLGFALLGLFGYRNLG